MITQLLIAIACICRFSRSVRFPLLAGTATVFRSSADTELAPRLLPSRSTNILTEEQLCRPEIAAAELHLGVKDCQVRRFCGGLGIPSLLKRALP
jgi:hypothetical protein